MTHRFELLVTGAASGLEPVAALFAQHRRIEVMVQPASKGSHDLLGAMHKSPDGAVILLSAAWQQELEALAARPPMERLPMVVIGPHEEPSAMRMAMRAGARDFLPAPAAPAEIVAAVERMISERRAMSRAHRGHLTAVINAKGGAGASTVAANVAHVLGAHCRRSTCLVDLDLQFGALPLHFDMSAQEGIVEALARVDSLDAVAVEGYMLRHPSGLHLLAGTENRAVAPESPQPAQLSRLLDLLLSNYEQVVADLPRHLGPLTAPLLQSADTVVMVTQQSVGHLRDARQLAAYFSRQFGVTSDRLWVAVNRYQKKLPITGDEISGLLNPRRLILLRNDYARVAASIDLGVPLFETARNAPITRELVALAEELPGAMKQETAVRQGLAHRLMRWATA